MANTRELRRRIKSVKNTSQITKAMQMVAAVKMRKAQDQATSARPYNNSLNFALSKLLPKIDKSTHPLFLANNSKKIGIILLTTDKALCGALNTNVLRSVQNFVSGGARHPDPRLDDYLFYTIGKKGRQYLVKTGRELQADFENTDQIKFRQAVQFTKIVSQAFLAGELGEVYIIYSDFVSTLRQEPKILKLLPIDPSAVIPTIVDRSTDARNDNQSEFLFEPNLNELLDNLLNHFLETKIYQALLETKASEHSARMIAMKNATDNAKELVTDLTLAYNQTRQAAITSELLEITTAQKALE